MLSIEARRRSVATWGDTPPEAADFFGGDLARVAVGSLATLPTDLAQQRAYTGAALISGYAAGQDLHQHFGVQLLDQPQAPFGDLSMLVKQRGRDNRLTFEQLCATPFGGALVEQCKTYRRVSLQELAL